MKQLHLLAVCRKSSRMKTETEDKDYWVYMLLCENNHYYTGYTSDLKTRYEDHVHGTGGCKYTRSFKPIKLAQCWRIKSSKSLAMQLEHVIKRCSRSQKEKLILQPENLSSDPRVQTLTAKQLAKLFSPPVVPDERRQ